eukprot:6208485-Pleurochrysis_carterae.AAC.2
MPGVGRPVEKRKVKGGCLGAGETSKMDEFCASAREDEHNHEFVKTFRQSRQDRCSGNNFVKTLSSAPAFIACVFCN